MCGALVFRGSGLPAPPDIQGTEGSFVPLYEYQCKSCGHTFEKIQSFSAPEEKECPVCGGPVEKLLSAPAVQFKGSGWYVTDYAGKGGGSGKKPSGDGAGKAEGSSGEKSSGSSSSSGSSGSSSESGSGSKTPSSGSSTASKSE